MNTYILLTEDMLIQNGFTKRTDGTFVKTITNSNDTNRKYIYIELWEHDYPNNRPFWLNIFNGLTELKTHIGTVKQLKTALCICGFSSEAIQFNVDTNMSDERFWNIVKEIDWKKYYKSSYNIEICKANLERALNDDETLYAFSNKLDEMFDRLNDAIYGDESKDEYCSMWKYTQQEFANQMGWYYLGDDSWYDLRMHIIGLGKSDFNKVLKDPHNLRKYIDYRECFSYICQDDCDAFCEYSPKFLTNETNTTIEKDNINE